MYVYVPDDTYSGWMDRWMEVSQIGFTIASKQAEMILRYPHSRKPLYIQYILSPLPSSRQPPSAVRASVRAMIRKSGELRASSEPQKKQLFHPTLLVG